MKVVKHSLDFTEIELRAAFVACSNYTPSRGDNWAQSAQARTVRKIKSLLVRIQKSKAKATEVKP